MSGFSTKLARLEATDRNYYIRVRMRDDLTYRLAVPILHGNFDTLYLNQSIRVDRFSCFTLVVVQLTLRQRVDIEIYDLL